MGDLFNDNMINIGENNIMLLNGPLRKTFILK